MVRRGFDLALSPVPSIALLVGTASDEATLARLVLGGAEDLARGA